MYPDRALSTTIMAEHGRHVHDEMLIQQWSGESWIDRPSTIEKEHGGCGWANDLRS